MGKVCPPGFLPAYSVDTEKEARLLVTMTCQMGVDGKHYARELFNHRGEPLTGDARIRGFVKFGQRLAAAHERMKER